MQSKILFRNATGLAGLALSFALAAAPVQGRTVERGVESAHQPQVERTDFVFDVASSANGSLSDTDGRRLTAWLDALGLRYGDHVSFGGAAGGSFAGVRDSVSDIVARYGLLTEGEAPLTAGNPPAGSVRIVVSRSAASVPGCPTWQDSSQTKLKGGLSDNYGCAMASNLAAMVADPQDLVQGRTTTTDLRTATGSRAIKAYQEKAPTGAGSLQVMSVGGQ